MGKEKANRWVRQSSKNVPTSSLRLLLARLSSCLEILSLWLKLGDLKPVWSRELPAYPSSVTVIKDAANRYFLSFVVEIAPVQIEAQNSSIGIDLGIKTFAVMSNGDKAFSPSYKQQDRKIRKLQRKLARQLKGSKRRHTTRLRIAKQHNQIADKRSDFLHKLSTKVVSENQAIVLEDLNVSGMTKNRKTL